MATINIMVAVDVETAQSTASGNVITKGLYMIDTTGYEGTAEGGNELTTPCNAGDTLVWTIYPINPSDNIAITGFTGTAVNDKIFQNLGQQKTPAGVVYWTCAINFGTQSGSYQYSLNISMSGKSYTYDPFVKVTAN
ncbi:hypothetical protein FBZ89_12667 [Nitrospirillum amazonense]|uniref:Inclusion body protein n=1 Tax=Nitrospirillum amazonense TaxID=28077 RepID=A0A560ESD2_9PROT|nr:hypothetical protein [Nitrospirillum amazonense]TWB12288.1 hypothetical protein FBZ89_12667 [Nitrospirillum amazonense]